MSCFLSLFFSFFIFFFSSLTFSNMVWITNPDVGERRKRRRKEKKEKKKERIETQDSP